MVRQAKAAKKPDDGTNWVLTEAPDKETWQGPKDRSILSDDDLAQFIRGSQEMRQRMDLLRKQGVVTRERVEEPY